MFLGDAASSRPLEEVNQRGGRSGQVNELGTPLDHTWAVGTWNEGGKEGGKERREEMKSGG